MTEELKQKIQKLESALEQKRQELAKGLVEIEAEQSEEVKATLEEKVNTIAAEIDALKASAQLAYDNYTRLTPSNFSFESSKSKGADITKLEQMLNNMEVKSGGSEFKKKTPGTVIGDFLKANGVKDETSFENFFSGKQMLTFQFNLDESDLAATNEVKALPSIKSLYSNGGEEIAGVPGYQGYGCSIFEVQDECKLCCEPRTFEECLTVRNMPYGSVVQYDYQVSRDDNAAGVVETIYNPYPTFVAGHNGTKPESTFTFRTAKVKVSKIAHFIVASDEVLDDCSKVADRIDFHLTTGLLRERDRQLIAGTGAGAEMQGLLTQPGTLALDGNVIAAGIPNANIWDKLYLAMLELEQNCAVVDCVIVNPADRAKVALAKDTQGNYLFPQNGCDVQGIGCLSLKTSPDVPVGTAIIGELKNNWVWYNRKNLSVRVGYTGDQFITNTKTFLAELRGANVLFCPHKVGVISNI